MILHTDVKGKGEPLVLFHSFGNTGSSMYEEVTQFFVDKNYQVMRPDLRGHGGSAGEIKNYFSYAADDVKDTLDSFGIEKCHIAGVSYGGIEVLLFAQKYPEYVKSLTISGVFPIKPEVWDESEQEEAEGLKNIQANSETASILDEMHGNGDWRRLFQSVIDNEESYPFDQIRDVSTIGFPMLCISGGSSELEIANALNFKELNPEIHMSIIPFAGHLVSEDQPLIYSQTLHCFMCEVERNEEKETYLP